MNIANAFIAILYSSGLFSISKCQSYFLQFFDRKVEMDFNLFEIVRIYYLNCYNNVTIWIMHQASGKINNYVANETVIINFSFSIFQHSLFHNNSNGGKEFLINFRMF